MNLVACNSDACFIVYTIASNYTISTSLKGVLRRLAYLNQHVREQMDARRELLS
jgi:hypothetical protein